MPDDVTITRLTPGKKPGEVQLFVDHAFHSTVPEILVVKFGLREGAALARDQLEEVTREAALYHATESAYKYLSIRPHSQRELRTKLLKKGHSKEAAAAALKKLVEQGFLDDRKFTENWVKERLAVRPRGRKVLMLELSRRGIKRELAEEVLNSAMEETSESEIAFSLLMKHPSRFRGQNSVDTRRKIYNFLSYRGFGYSAMREAAARFMANLKDYDDSTERDDL